MLRTADWCSPGRGALTESSKLWGMGREANIYRRLKHDLNISGVTRVATHEASTSNYLVVIQMDKPERADVWRALEVAGESINNGKLCITVDLTLIHSMPMQSSGRWG